MPAVTTPKPSPIATAALIAALAMVVGTVTERWSGTLIGAMLGYLLAQTLHLRASVRRLEEQLAERGRVAGAVSATPPPLPAATVAEAPPMPVSAAVSQAPAPAPETAAASPAVGNEAASVVTDTRSAPTAAWSPPAAPVTAPGIFDRWLAEAIAWLRGGNPLARIGIVVLFFGGAFLVKYSADRGLLPIEVRLSALALGTLALLGLGWRLRRKQPGFGQLLQGGGIAGLYLTLFGATRLYHLVPTALALPLLIAVALSGAILAVAQSALALAVIGFGGGFLAPILLSTGGGSHIALFSYYAVLNLGIFAVAWFRAWRVLNLVGFLFTFGIVGVFRAAAYSADKLVSTDAFVLLFFLMYVAVSILFSLRQKLDLKGYVSGSLVFGLPVAAFTLHATLVAHIEYGLACSALGFGFFYLVLAVALFRSGRDNLRLLSEAFAALGVIFASLAVPLAFDQRTTAAMWSIEGAGLLWIGLRQQRRLARAFAVGLQLLGGFGYLTQLDSLNGGTPVLNTACIGALMLAVAGCLSGWWLSRHRDGLARYEQNLDSAAALWATAWWLFTGLREIDRFVPIDYFYGAQLVFAGVSLLLLQELARRLTWRPPDIIATLLWPLTAVVALAWGFDRAHLFAQAGYVGWPVFIAATYALLWRRQAQSQAPLPGLTRWLHAGSYWVLAIVAMSEARWQIGRGVGGVWRDLPAGLVPALLVWAALRPLPLWPFSDHGDSYRIAGAAPLVIFAALWVLVINLGSSGDAGALPYVPLLNPLDIGVALVLAGLAYFWSRLTPDERAALQLLPTHAAVVAAVLGFVWLTAALLRALHHLADVPWNFDAMSSSFLVQASLSIFWGLLGLVVIALAARRRMRRVWIAGAALMGVVVAKLFLVDLDGSGSLARIVSFLGVGGLLLLAGYLSPLPPARPAQEHPT